jgi:hypothetical protein
MMKITIKEVNAVTGEETISERDETAAEIKSREDAIAAAQVRADEAAQKETIRQAVLAKLGLTADEVAALLG